MSKLLAALGLLCLLAGSASAESSAALPARARIVVSGCGERANERALLEQIRVELLSAGVTAVDVVELYREPGPDQQQSYDVATVRIGLPSCTDPAWEVALAISYRYTGKHRERLLNMSDIAEPARARAVALAVVELLRGTWRELASEPPVVEAAALPVIIDTERPPDLQPQSELQLEAQRRLRPRLEWAGASRIYPQTDSGDLATSLSISQLLGAGMRIYAGGTAAGGGGDGSNVRIFQGTARIALNLCSAGERPLLEVGTAWEVGWGQLRVSGAPRRGGLVAMGAVQATLRARVSHGVEGLLNLQAGYVLAPLTLESMLDDGRRRSVGLEGSVLGVGVGLAGIL